TGGYNISVFDYNSSFWIKKYSYNTNIDIKKVIAVNLDNDADTELGEEKIEIIALSDKYVYCFHVKDPDTLDLLWQYPIKQGSDLIVSNLCGDGDLEVIAAGEKVYVLDNSGARVWES